MFKIKLLNIKEITINRAHGKTYVNLIHLLRAERGKTD